MVHAEGGLTRNVALTPNEGRGERWLADAADAGVLFLAHGASGWASRMSFYVLHADGALFLSVGCTLANDGAFL